MTRTRRSNRRPVWRALRPLTGSALLILAPTLAWGAEGGSGLIDLKSPVLLAQLVNFLILLFVLYRWAYRPLLGTLEARTSAIKQQLAEAQAAREEAQRQLAEFEARLQAAQAEAQVVRERVLREAAELRERLTAEARQEAGRLLATARTEIEQSVRRARAELRTEVGGLALEIAERLMHRSLRDEDHQRLVQDALTRMTPS